MFKALCFLCVLTVVRAGAPAAVTYVANPSVGSGGANTIRGTAGTSSVTHQAKAVDSATSTVRKTDTRITNDAVAAAPVAYAQPALNVAPAYTYAQVQPAVAAAPVAYAQPQVAAAPVAYAKTVPQYAYAQPAAPVGVYQQALPPAYVQQAGYYTQQPVAAAPVSYGPSAFAAAPAVAYGTKTISAAPVASVSKVAAAPAAVQYSAPAVYSQPGFAQVAAAPVAKLATPLTTKAVAPARLLGVAFSPISPATASMHFNGFGTSYTLF